MGTQAHEWFQAHQQISPDLATASELHLLPGWKSIQTNLACVNRLHHYGCFPARFRCRVRSRYQGLRHDSGDPVEWGEKALHIMKSWELIHRVKRWFSLQSGFTQSG